MSLLQATIPPLLRQSPPFSFFAAAQACLKEQPSQHSSQSHSGSGKVRRPSISSAINWLSNAPAIQHMKGPQSVVISATSIDDVERFGELGKGATIVRTSAEALRNVGSNNNSTEFASPLSQTTSRPVHTHLPSLSLPVNPLPFSVREFDEHDPYAPTRTNTSTSNHSHVSGSSKHKRNGSRAVVATIRESELPPLPQSTMLAPRDGHAVHQRRAGAAGAGKTQGVLGRAAAVVADMYLRRAQGIYRHPHFLPGIPPLRQNASPMQMALKLREQDSSPARFQGFSTSVPLTPSAFSQYASRRSPAPLPLPMYLLLFATPQPAFDAMLMAPLPSDVHKTDVSKVIVVLETSTGSQKATLKPSSRVLHILPPTTSLDCTTRLQ